MEVAIVGAGIVGLAHAWIASERGHSVRVFERSGLASGASVRNFGMIWPIGQARGETHRLALLGRERWLRLRDEAGIWVNTCGSILLAHREDEKQVLKEFAERGPEDGYDCRWLGPEEIHGLTPASNPLGLRGGLLSTTELAVNPPAAIRALPRWLAETFDVGFEFRTTIVDAVDDVVTSADGRQWRFDRLIVCGGADVETLFPGEIARSGSRLCKLQMLRTRPQPLGWWIGPHLASGLSLRHYASFERCSGLSVLKARIAAETPELDHFGIHVMATQDDQGRVILGDSHEYDQDIDLFDRSEIEELILRELRNVLTLPDWAIEARWSGFYLKRPEGMLLETEPRPGVFLRTALGGSGMTLAFALAERDWERWG